MVNWFNNLFKESTTWQIINSLRASCSNVTIFIQMNPGVATLIKKRLCRFVNSIQIIQGNMIKFLQTLLLFSIMQSALCQDSSQNTSSLYILNADRLYDNVDDPGAVDDDFSASGALGWDKQKYEKRCDDIAGIIAAGSSGELPSIIVLSGIEKKSIAIDILSSRKLRKANYTVLADSFYPGSGIIMASDDGKASLLEKRTIIPDLDPSLQDISVILYCKVKLEDGATYHMFLNEWPGRQAGSLNPGQMRMACAAALRKEVDLILNFERNARIIIMGTFFDEPTDGSIMNILNATSKRKNISERDLYNLYFDMHNNEDRGTVTVNGIWQMSDFIIVSPSLLSEGPYFSTSFEGGMIGEPSPSFGPAYRGSEYTGGSGAHLPVFLDLSLNGVK